MEEVLNILYEFLFAMPEGVSFGIAPLVAGSIVSGVGKVIGGLFGAGRARRARRRAAAEKRRLKGELNSLEKSRQKIVNPYSNTKDLSSLAVFPQAAELNKTANVVLLNDNINKIPRDLNETSDQQKQFRI